VAPSASAFFPRIIRMYGVKRTLGGCAPPPGASNCSVFLSFTDNGVLATRLYTWRCVRKGRAAPLDTSTQGLFGVRISPTGPSRHDLLPPIILPFISNFGWRPYVPAISPFRIPLVMFTVLSLQYGFFLLFRGPFPFVPHLFFLPFLAGEWELPRRRFPLS